MRQQKAESFSFVAQLSPPWMIGSHAFDWSIGPTLFAKPRDTITWARHQMRAPAIIFHTIRPSGQNIYLILFIQYELSIVSKNENQHRVAEKIPDFFVQKIVFDFFYWFLRCDRFSEFRDWERNRFFKILGLRLGLQIHDNIARNPRNPKKSKRWLWKFYIHELNNENKCQKLPRRT